MDGSALAPPEISTAVYSSTPAAAGHSTARIPRAKRLFDIAAAAAVLLVVAPFMLILYLLVRLDGGPAIFAHRRVGQNGRDFHCFKFRTMFPDAGARLEELLRTDACAREEWARDHKLRRDPRVTPLGRILRASSLDELPQLINILRGEMSVVGPRPIVQAEIVRYGHGFASYCRSRPGLTGLWQVSGRNDVSYRRRVAMDVLYSRRATFLLDMKIVFLTVPAVLFSRGSY